MTWAVRTIRLFTFFITFWFWWTRKKSLHRSIHTTFFVNLDNLDIDFALMVGTYSDDDPSAGRKAPSAWESDTFKLLTRAFLDMLTREKDSVNDPPAGTD